MFLKVAAGWADMPFFPRELILFLLRRFLSGFRSPEGDKAVMVPAVVTREAAESIGGKNVGSTAFPTAESAFLGLEDTELLSTHSGADTVNEKRRGGYGGGAVNVRTRSFTTDGAREHLTKVAMLWVKVGKRS